MSKASSPTRTHRWGEIRQRALTFNSKVLVSILQDLYELSAENRRFLNTRFMGGEVELEEYRKRIRQAIYPDPLSSRPVRVPEAVRMIGQFYRATGDVSRTIGLLLYALEIGVEQANDLGMYEEYFSRLATVGKTFLQIYAELPAGEQDDVRHRFRRIVDRGRGIAYGFVDYLCDILIELES
jgi:hypothetical protein